jgi:hypothetical protein
VKERHERADLAKEPDAVASGVGSGVRGVGLQVGEKGVVALSSDHLEEGLFTVLEEEMLFSSEFATFFKHVAVAVRDGGVAV